MSETAGITIVRDPTDLLAVAGPVTWAVEQLRQALSSQGVLTDEVIHTDETAPGTLCVLVGSQASPLIREGLNRLGATMPGASEALVLLSGELNGRPTVVASGSDVRGLVYATLELADRVTHIADPLDALTIQHPVVEQPANPIRGVSRFFSSEVEDKSWYHDRSFWQRYLTMLVTQRFNRFHLGMGIAHNFLREVRDTYFLFPYPFLVSPPGYDVRPTGLSDQERTRNLETLRFISDETVARGLQFQIGIWMHGYQWVDSPHADSTIVGLAADQHAEYCRDALRMLLQECPAISIVTFRVHGESGVPEGSYEFWRTVFDGVVDCGRKVEIDLHPKGVDPKMIKVALDTGMPVNISPKYAAEHMGLPSHQAAIRPNEQHPDPSDLDGFMTDLMNRSAGDLRYTRYSYADFLAEDRAYGVYYRFWPGTQRFLLWGDPAFVGGFGRYGTFCDSLGIEIYDPLSYKGRMGSGLPGGRDGYVDASLRSEQGDFEKYLYTYRLWGRLLYNPDADPEVWRRFLRYEFGDAAEAAEVALANASGILPLITATHHPSASNHRYWPEIYTNMPIVDETRPHPYQTDTPTPRRFGTVYPLDAEMFMSIDDFADEVIQGERNGKYSPLRVATWLDKRAEAATRNLAEAETHIADPENPAYRRLSIDVKIQSALGRFFADKFRAGVAYALYTRTQSPARLQEAVNAYKAARQAWVDALEPAAVYRDDLTYGMEPFLRGHWDDRLPAIDDDLGDMEAEWHRISQAGTEEGQSSSTMPPLASLDTEPQALNCKHEAPTEFEPGKPVTIRLTAPEQGGVAEITSIQLRYRRVNQAEPYRVVEMEDSNGTYQGTIPADYTDTPYPLMYHFKVRSTNGQPQYYPGLASDLANQPYFVIRQQNPSTVER